MPQSSTPLAVRAFGVTRVRASPSTDRDASVRAPVVYPSLIAAALVTTRTVPASCASARSGSAGGRLRPMSGKQEAAAVVVDDRHRHQGHSDACHAVEPEVVAGRHHCEPHPGGPDGPEGLRPRAPADTEEHDADD